MKPNNIIKVICIIVFILTFLLRINYINQKIGFHLDEVLSINISNRSGFMWTKPLPADKAYTGKELKSMVLYSDSSFIEALKDIKKMHKYNNDVPHTNFYYSLLRTWFIGADNTDVKTIVWHGTSLNLALFTLSFFIMYKILNIIFKDKTLVPFGLLVAFANTASISNTLFIRPYQLQECIFLLLTYVFFILYNDIKNKKLLTSKNFLIASITMALTLLTGYLTPVYICLLWSILGIVSIKEKQYKNVTFLVGIVIASIIFAKIGYLSYFKGFNCYVSQKAIVNLTNVFHNLKLSLIGYINNLVYYLFYIPCLIILGFIWLDKKQEKIEKSEIAKYLIILAFISTIFMILPVPFKILRYIVALFPILSIVYPYSIEGKNKKYIYMTLISIMFLILALIPYKTDSLQTISSKNFSISKIENLFLRTENLTNELQNNKQYPVFIPANLLMIQIIPYFNDEQIYYVYSTKKPEIQTNEILALNINKFDNSNKKIHIGWESPLIKLKNKNQ